MAPHGPEATLPSLAVLHVWCDGDPRGAAANMALDEALLDWSMGSGQAAIRLYTWDHTAITTGYFPDRGTGDPRTAPPSGGTGRVRRFTGGGLVEHGEDVTFALAVPATAARDASLPASSAERYRWIHGALAGALTGAGMSLETVAAGHAGRTGPCFTHPVPWDLVDPATGRKIAGGAQRRSRGAFLHQGSVRLPEGMRSPDAPWVASFLAGLALSTMSLGEEIRKGLLAAGEDLVVSRYGDPAWNEPTTG